MRYRHTLIDNCTSTQCHSLNIPSQCFVRLSVKVLDQYSVHKTLQTGRSIIDVAVANNTSQPVIEVLRYSIVIMYDVM